MPLVRVRVLGRVDGWRAERIDRFRRQYAQLAARNLFHHGDHGRAGYIELPVSDGERERKDSKGKPEPITTSGRQLLAATVSLTPLNARSAIETTAFDVSL